MKGKTEAESFTCTAGSDAESFTGMGSTKNTKYVASGVVGYVVVPCRYRLQGCTVACNMGPGPREVQSLSPA